MRSKTNLPVFLAYGLVSLLVLGYLARQMGGEFFLQSAYHVRAAFATGSQLVPGDDVTLSGLRVGRVDSVQPAASGASVDLVIHSDFAPLYQDARAVVRAKNLLGETYVELNRGSSSSGPLADGGAIPAEHTLTPVEVDQVLNVLGPDVRQRLALLINTLGEATAGRGGDLNLSAVELREVATDLQTTAKSLAGNQEHLDRLIASLRKILDTLAAWHKEFAALVTDWDRLMKTLYEKESDLKGTFVEQDRVLAIFDQALAGTSPNDLHQALAEAPAALDHANHYLDDADRVFGVLAQPQHAWAIAMLFNELASVMSWTDANGNHRWRVYDVPAGNGP